MNTEQYAHCIVLLCKNIWTFENETSVQVRNTEYGYCYAKTYEDAQHIVSEFIQFGNIELHKINSGFNTKNIYGKMNIQFLNHDASQNFHCQHYTKHRYLHDNGFAFNREIFDNRIRLNTAFYHLSIEKNYPTLSVHDILHAYYSGNCAVCNDNTQPLWVSRCSFCYVIRYDWYCCRDCCNMMGQCENCICRASLVIFYESCAIHEIDICAKNACKILADEFIVANIVKFL